MKNQNDKTIKRTISPPTQPRFAARKVGVPLRKNLTPGKRILIVLGGIIPAAQSETQAICSNGPSFLSYRRPYLGFMPLYNKMPYLHSLPARYFRCKTHQTEGAPEIRADVFNRVVRDKRRFFRADGTFPETAHTTSGFRKIIRRRVATGTTAEGKNGIAARALKFRSGQVDSPLRNED